MRRVSRSPRSQSPSRAATQSACFRAEEHVDSPLASQAEAGRTRNSEQTAAPSNLKLSLDSIHKVLAISQVFPLVHPARRKTLHPYSRLIPRDRVQLNTCKIAPGCYQYTLLTIVRAIGCWRSWSEYGRKYRFLCSVFRPTVAGNSSWCQYSSG